MSAVMHWYCSAICAMLSCIHVSINRSDRERKREEKKYLFVFVLFFLFFFANWVQGYGTPR